MAARRYERCHVPRRCSSAALINLLALILFLAASGGGLAAMGRRHRALDKLWARYDRAVQRGFWQDKPKGYSHVLARSSVAGRVRTVAQALGQHEALNEKAGRSFHHLRAAALATKDQVPAEQFEATLALNQRAGRAKHRWPSAPAATSGACHDLGLAVDPVPVQSDGPSQLAWADLEDDDSYGGPWEAPADHRGPQPDDFVHDQAQHAQEHPAEHPADHVPHPVPTTAASGASEVWATIVSQLAHICSVLDTLTRHVMQSSDVSLEPSFVTHMRAQVEQAVSKASSVEARVTEKLDKLQERLCRLADAGSGLSPQAGTSSTDGPGVGSSMQKHVSFCESLNTVAFFHPDHHASGFAASSGDLEPCMPPRCKDCHMRNWCENCSLCSACHKCVCKQSSVPDSEALDDDEQILKRTGANLRTRDDENTVFDADSSPNLPRSFGDDIVGGHLKVREHTDAWIPHWVQSFKHDVGHTLLRDDLSDDDDTEVVLNVSALYAQGSVRFCAFTDQAGRDFSDGWELQGHHPVF